MKKVLILGASGLLGSTLSDVLAQSGLPVERHDKRPEDAPITADLMDALETRKMLDAVRPCVIINLAALANVDECERNPQQAYLSNVHIVENLAAWIKESVSDCHLVQISTDQVYDGSGPHKESPITLTNTYGFSKYAGELAAVRVPCTVLRTNFFGPSRTPRRTSISDWMVKSLKAQEPITVFEDVLFSPLSMKTLSAMIGHVVMKPERGVFNLSSKDGMSKADFAFVLANTIGLPTHTMCRGSVAALKAPAYRPRDMRMDSSKFEAVFGVQLPSLREEIESMRDAYEAK